MEWRDQGIVLTTQNFGETSVILDVLTREHGRRSGVIRGGISRKYRPILQPGSVLDISWRARLADHLGSFQVDLVKSRAAALENRFALAGLGAVTALIHKFLPEQDPVPDFYDQTQIVLDALMSPPVFAYAYFHWEAALLDVLGFGLDLSSCAVTGATQDLIYVSPKSGRAVSRLGAGEWANRLLPLPNVAKGLDRDLVAVAQGLQLTGYFLEHKAIKALEIAEIPPARGRFLDALAKASVENE